MRKISDILKEERLKKGYTLSDVEKEIKIKRVFLEALERGDFKKLPSESYALGFVKTYASHLGISPTTAAALFRREYEGKKVEIMPTYKKKPTTAGRKLLLRSPRGYFIAFLALIILGYVAFQFSFLFVGPKLSVESPSNGQIVKTNVIQVSGKTDPYATVTVNSEEVYVDLSGSFKKTLYVYSGETDVTVVAKNRSGRTTTEIIRLKVE